MPCLSPITLKNQRGHLNPTTQVPCGKCVSCLERRRNDWSIRLNEELRISQSAVFLTLTYRDENIPYDESTGEITLKKSDIQNYMKKLRVSLSRGISTTNFLGKSVKTPKNDVKIKYFMQGEYGSKKDRPHYHMILFNFPSNIDYLLEKLWIHGFVHYGECNKATIHYCTKYMITKYDPDFKDRVKPFALMSKGLGKSYADRNGAWHRETEKPTYTMIGGTQYPLPRYLKDKIFSEDQKKVIGSRNLSYAKRRAINDDLLLLKDVKSDHEFFEVKDARIESYSKRREKFLNKKNLL